MFYGKSWNCWIGYDVESVVVENLWIGRVNDVVCVKFGVWRSCVNLWLVVLVMWVVYCGVLIMCWLLVSYCYYGLFLRILV